MHSREAFLQAIVEDPDDDTPRLIYADWLEEHGDVHRAEFIRVQCELARLPEDEEARRPALLTREWTLLSTHAKEWLAELPSLEGIKWDEVMPTGKRDMVPCFERGFASAVIAENEKAFEKQAAALFRAAPIKELRINERIEDLEVFLSCPELERLRRLGMAAQVDRSRIGMLVNCPRLSRLTELDLSLNKLGDEGVQTLIESPHLTRLTNLDLGSNDISAAGIRSLSTWPVHRQLQYLGLAGNSIGEASARELLSWPSLTDLVLNGNNIGPGWVSALVESPLLARLRWLSLGGNSIGNEGIRLLADCSRPISLFRLGLGSNGIGPAAITRLARATWLHRLEELDLGWNLITSAGAKTLAFLAASGHVPKLKILELQYTRIGDVGASALADSPLPSQLAGLVLRGNRIRKAIVSRLRERMGDRLEI
ncbi:MAG TPA: TIGR02996 domain-containing protein [Gemmataceae bacterium]|jgi:uncharacterized protein (TIGR02996 family)